MQCLTPMYRQFEIANYKKTVRIVPRAEVQQDLEYNPNTIRQTLRQLNNSLRKRGEKIELIPCGHCVACKLNYSADWATRTMLKCMESEHNYFITLTYDDEHLPIMDKSQVTLKKKGAEFDTLETLTFENDGTWITGTLWPDHVKTFLDSLRHKMRKKGIKGIQYFYCGEYGSQNLRPHYHLLLFSCPMNLSQNYDYHIDENFKEHWKNPLIGDLWKHGIHDIANIEWSSAAYVSRYATKKLFTGRDNKIEYARIGKLPEFIRMSRKPGIGFKYYEEHKHDIYKLDSMTMKTVKGNTGSFKPPKAFDKKFKEEYPEEWDIVQANRKKCAERSRQNNYAVTDYTDREMLEIKKDNIETKANMLLREL